MRSDSIEGKAINTIRTLSMDAVQAANSGHPGMPMGAADRAFVLWSRCLRYDPKAPLWPDRDRFVLSAGHGSMLLYGLLHLSGFEAMTLEQIREALRQASDAGTVEWIYYEGGEPFLYYATLLAAVRAAAASGFKVGVVSNGYWATSKGDALECLRPFEGMLSDLAISRDRYHLSDRFPERAEDLTTEAVEELRRGRQVTDLDIVFGAERKEALEARARVLWTLPFKAMWEEHHQPAEPVPFVLGADDELVDDHLRAVREIAELRLPDHERVRPVEAVAIVKAKDP